tara:strand:- start:179 stop:388 length:210 start_codon:yes stop_codon:yes gene_type:complete
MDSILGFKQSYNLRLSAKYMNRRTSQNQRKSKLPNFIRRQPKKEKAKVKEVVAKAEDTSCQTRGCGCGN